MNSPSEPTEFKRKNDYSITAYQGSRKVNTMVYVHSISSYVKYLEKRHINWSVINVYARRTRRFLKRYYKDRDIIPDRIEG
ncbi:MAG TPA: hypothetical protein DDX98_16415 [Bacteroidales bacterium]|jgi:hypothetical protein|nr:hypothetical protein [Bacteroidales bacterium]